MKSPRRNRSYCSFFAQWITYTEMVNGNRREREFARWRTREREKERDGEGETPTDIQIASGVPFASYRTETHDFSPWPSRGGFLEWMDARIQDRFLPRSRDKSIDGFAVVTICINCKCSNVEDVYWNLATFIAESSLWRFLVSYLRGDPLFLFLLFFVESIKERIIWMKIAPFFRLLFSSSFFFFSFLFFCFFRWKHQGVNCLNENNLRCLTEQGCAHDEEDVCHRKI